MDWTQVIIVGIAAIISAIGGAVGGVILARSNAHKIHAEAKAVESGTHSEQDKSEIAALSSIIEKLEQSYKNLSERSASDLSEMRNRLLQSDDDWRILSTKIETIESQREALFENSKRLQDQLISAQEEIRKLHQQIADLKELLLKKDAELSRKNRELEAKNAELAEKNREIENYQDRLTVAIAELEKARRSEGKL